MSVKTLRGTLDTDTLTRFTEHIAEKFFWDGVDRVVGIEGGGAVLAGAVAYKLGAGASLLMKKGEPHQDAYFVRYTGELGKEGNMEIYADSISTDEKVLIVCDSVESVELIKAAIALVEKCGGKVMGVGTGQDESGGAVKKDLGSYNFYCAA